MYQDQNNLNQNSNIQNNNGIPNNQPLNNTYGQIPQQPINQQNVQTNNSFNQPQQIIQPQPIQQPIQSQPVQNNNYSINNNKGKKKLVVICSIIIGLVAIIIASLFLLKPKSESSNTNEDSANKDNVKITGDIKLIKEYEKNNNFFLLRFETGPYIAYINGSEKTAQILNSDGKIMFTSDSRINYIKDGYFENSSTDYKSFEIINTKGEKTTFDIEYDLTFYYENNILYYSYEDTQEKKLKTRAYDLKSKKVLWEVDGANPFVFEDQKMLLHKSKGPKNRIILDKMIVLDKTTGKTLIKADSDEESLYAAQGCYYIISETKIDTYDYNNNKLSSHNFVRDEESLEKILNGCGYVMEIYDEKSHLYDNHYKVYNKKGEEILSIETGKLSTPYLYERYGGGGLVIKNSTYSTDKYSLLSEISSRMPLTYIIYPDDTIIKLYDMRTKGNYAIGYTDAENEKIKIINLETREEKIPDEPLLNQFDISDNNSYFIISASYDDEENKFYVYDNNLNKIYSSSNRLEKVNNDYFLEIDTTNHEKSQIFLINAKTQKKTFLDTKGVYEFNTANNLVTYDFNGDKEYLYKFK